AERLPRGLQPGDRHLPEPLRGAAGDRPGRGGHLPRPERPSDHPFRLLVPGRTPPAPDALGPDGAVPGPGHPARDRHRRPRGRGALTVAADLTPAPLPPSTPP